MALHDLAGKPAPKSMLVNISGLVSSYYTNEPGGPVSFGTSGHRGSSLKGTFNEGHIIAISRAICEYRASKGINGPLFLGFDTHALSEPAFRTALEIFATNKLVVVIHAKDEYTPTPVISYLILEHNRGRRSEFADGVVITPSHNPPQDGGFKYNPPHGGPADVDVTGWIQDRANQLMNDNSSKIKRMPYEKARRASTIYEKDFITPFVESLSHVIDLETIKKSGVKIGADPMGGSGVRFWYPIAKKYGLNIEVVNPDVDPTFGFMTVDTDGEIRMDCSSPYAMANLIAMADRFDIAWGNDSDFDRHGIVCPSGLMNPNHYLSVAIWYLLQNRPAWDNDLKVGKTLVSSSMIDRIVTGLKKELYEVPVGFKWFVQGLLKGTLAFGGEESAGASFLRKDGSVWSTDKDGFSLTLLAAEILAKTRRTPAEIYKDTLVPQYGEPFYKRADGPIADEQKAVLKSLTPDSIKIPALAGLSITKVMTTAPGNNAAIGGVKVVLDDGSWFAIRPSGTEPKMKVYIESFGGEDLWQQIQKESLPLIFE
ncbi:MAG: phosphoglucomutase (alpha-D-glucose-1,6-bisphosphate-dependent), partial [Thermodesulfobacteriota bacterium]|nr:phosphoglucomutase (alpha-D-glucose-1,6-bisphosphate-dependent) [Thermodesulfobacteriota bacterium]